MEDECNQDVIMEDNFKDGFEKIAISAKLLRRAADLERDPARSIRFRAGAMRREFNSFSNKLKGVANRTIKSNEKTKALTKTLSDIVNKKKG